jgi:tripartite-type tricarboxylate transporter receptor subunit TctC
MKPIAGRIGRLFGLVLCLSLAMPLDPSGASAQDFYKDKQIRLIAGFPAGNDYDLGARLLAKYLPKYIPGEPSIIVQNMPQAASVAAANYLYAQAPRDGTVFGSFSRNIVNDALTGESNVTADPRRFLWLGATSRPARVCVRWFTAPVKTPADLFTHEFIVGAAGATSSLAIVPTVLNKVLGTKFNIVEGYQGMGDAMSPCSAARRKACARRTRNSASPSNSSTTASCSFCCAPNRRQFRRSPTCRRSSIMRRPTNNAHSCNSYFRRRNSAGPMCSRPKCRRIALR